MRTISGVKLVALDVDGTLVDHVFQIPPRTLAAIRQARERGVRFVIVTGRMYQSATRYARELGLEELPLVAYNGALVKEYPSGRTIYHEPVALETCKALAAFCEARGYHMQAYLNDELYVPDLGQRTQDYVRIASVKPRPVGSLFLWFSEPSTKLLIYEDPARIPEIQEEVRSLLGPAVHAAPSYPMFLEVVSSRVSKGRALETVAASLGVEREAVVAVGDGMNDMEMIRWAGTSFAISHAPEPLRKAATYVTESGAGDGVAEALERLGLSSYMKEGG